MKETVGSHGDCSRVQASYGVAASAVADDAATDAAKIALKGGRFLVELLMVVVMW